MKGRTPRGGPSFLLLQAFSRVPAVRAEACPWSAGLRLGPWSRPRPPRPSGGYGRVRQSAALPL